MEIEDDKTGQRLSTLSRSRLFRAASEEELKKLGHEAREVRLEAGEFLFSAGDPSAGLFVVISGRTRAVRHSPEGREQVIHEDSVGSTFPEVAVFDDGPYPSTVMAVEASTLLFIPKERVRQFCLRNPEVALEALRILASRLRKTSGLAENLSLKGVDQRLAEFLLAQARSRSAAKFELTHSNQEIADLIGTVREVVSRAFGRLQRKGWIRKSGRHIELLRPAELEDFCSS